MKAEYKKLWIEALRSGQYQQGQCELRSADDSRCCLGVLCDVVDSSKWIYNERHERYEWGDYSCTVPHEVCNVTGFDNESGSVYYRMNDDERKSFAEIADYIEEFEPTE